MGRHSQSVSLQDVAGSVAKYTNTFVVTTSFDDLAVVIDQYSGNALRTTLNGAHAVGATALRLQTPFGFRAGQSIVIDSGDDQETVTIAKTLSPPPTLNTTLSAAASAGATEVRLASYTTSDSGGPNAEQQRADRRPADRARHGRQPRGRHRRAPHHARAAGPRAQRRAQRAAGEGPRRGHPDEPVEPHPQRTAGEGARRRGRRHQPAAAHLGDVASELKDLLVQAEAADAGNRNRAISTLNRFNATVLGRLAGRGEATERAALSSAAKALIDQVNGVPVDTSGTGVEVGPADDGAQAIRAFWNPSPFMANPEATYKVLVNGRGRWLRRSRSSTSRH